MSTTPPTLSELGYRCDHTTGCITCSDEGIPMRVVSAATSDGIAWCIPVDRPEGSVALDPDEVMIGVVAPVAVGDTVLVHAGTALLKLSVASAQAHT